MAVTDVPRPTAAPSGFVVVKVVAAALNPVDKIRIAGGLKTFFPEKTFPAIVGYDLAGVVEAVGSGVTRWPEKRTTPATHRAGCFAASACLG